MKQEIKDLINEAKSLVEKHGDIYFTIPDNCSGDGWNGHLCKDGCYMLGDDQFEGELFKWNEPELIDWIDEIMNVVLTTLDNEKKHKIKSYDECIELGNNKNIDDIVNQYHILQESLRHFFSRWCCFEHATDEETMMKFDEPVYVDDTPCGMPDCDKYQFVGMYEVECEGIIVFVVQKPDGTLVDYDIDELSIEKQVEIACAIEGTDAFDY